MEISQFIKNILKIIHSSPIEALNRTLEAICQVVGCEYGVILTYDRQNDLLVSDVLFGYPVKDVLRLRNERVRLPVKRGTSVAAKAFIEAHKTGMAVPIIQSAHDRDYYAITASPVKEVMGFAVDKSGRYVAVLVLESQKESTFQRFGTHGEASDLLLIFSNLISLALAVRQSIIFELDEFLRLREFNDLDILSESIVWWVYRNFNVNYCALFLEEYDNERGEHGLVCRGSILDGKPELDLFHTIYQIGEGYCGWVAAYNASLYLTDQDNADSYEFDYYQAQYGTMPKRADRFRHMYPHLPFKSYLGVPVTDGKEVLGVLEVLNTEREYVSSDESLLEMVARRIAAEYSRIVKEARKQSFFEIPNIFDGDLIKVAHGVIDAAIKITSATHGFFMLKEDDGSFHPRAVKGYGLSESQIPIIKQDQQTLINLVTHYRSAFLIQDTTDLSNLEPWAVKYVENSLTLGGFIPPSIRSLLVVPVYLKDQTDIYDDIGALVLMSSKSRAFQQDEIVITALVEIVSYHIWGNKKIAELESKNKQVLEFERTLPKYDAAIIAATASAGTVHTARRYMSEISQAISNLAEHKKIRSDKELLNLTARISHPFDELIQIYDRLLGVFRGIEPRYELCSIASLIQEVRDYLEPTLRERKITFRYIDKGIAQSRVKADPLLMKVVLINIVRNSIEAAAREIVIEARKGIISRWRADERAAVEILCKDNGIGIPEEDWENVFHFFYTANKKMGTGLGLAVNRNILDKHEGEIQVISSEVGKGTIISIKWPLDPFEAAG